MVCGVFALCLFVDSGRDGLSIAKFSQGAWYQNNIQSYQSHIQNLQALKVFWERRSLVYHPLTWLAVNPEF